MDTNDPLISVIIPNFNYARYVNQTIESVLKQTYTNLECIVVDDGSTDNSAEVINAYVNKDNRVKLIAKTNGGLSSSRNEGIKVAKGQYIAFLDSDDLWRENKLRNQMEFFKAHPEVSIVYSNSDSFNKDGILPFKEHVFIELHPLKLVETNSMPGCSSNFMITAAMVKKTGFFDGDLRSGEDLDYLFRCSLQGAKFGFVTSNDVMIRTHETSMLTNHKRMFFNNWHCFEKDLKLLKDSEFYKRYTRKELDHSISIRIQTIRWNARNDRNIGFIWSTYMMGANHCGPRYYFKKFTLSNLFYDLKLIRQIKKERRANKQI
jgi:glycosyltransferase involved in cell wall biosynthesis